MALPMGMWISAGGDRADAHPQGLVQVLILIPHYDYMRYTMGRGGDRMRGRKTSRTICITCLSSPGR